MRSRRTTRLIVVAAAAAGLGIPLAALAAAGGGGSTAASRATPSFTRDVAPIVRDKCTGCHRVGGIAPFPLATAKQIAARAPLIEAAVRERRMPPWPPGVHSPEYVGQSERALDAAQRATILSWLEGGASIDGPALGTLPPATTSVPPGESALDLRMPAPYRPRSRKGSSDDYRCFLLDPKLTGDASVTSARIVPGAPKVVHHVVLFRIAKSQLADARRLDASAGGPGWTCFGGTGLPLSVSGGGVRDTLDNANWVAAWAPGWGGGRLPEGTGVPLPAGSRIVMQVHYNLLNGRAPDHSRAVLTVAPASAGLEPLQTMLLPAPVELACARDESGPLCDRDRALAELVRKYGVEAGLLPSGLLLVCGQGALRPRPSEVSTCERSVTTRTTIHVVAGHMHLLGTSIRIELNPGTPDARVLLDIPRWDFHWQNAYALVEPVRAEPGDVVRVTCRYDVRKRRNGEHQAPRTPRYVLWGEGTTDEMCLGLLQVTRG